MRSISVLFLVVCLVVFGSTASAAPGRDDARLPQGVRAVWDIDRADRETTPTRERISINGLWRWQPADGAATSVPAGGWGYFKVPGCWPGITDYLQKDCQTLYAHPAWKNQGLRDVAAAWYQREVTVPAPWSGRRITLCAEYLNSYAAVYLDGKKAGEMRFPGGELDVTAACRPGSTHVLSMLVVAMPLQALMLSYSDTASAREVKGSVPRRGLCGDVFLASAPAGARLGDVKIDTSVRKGAIRLDASVEGLQPGRAYALAVRVSEGGRKVEEFRLAAFKAEDLREGRIALVAAWKPDKLWDIHTPQNQYDAQVGLVDAQGKALDVLPAVRFGFREFWIDGRDFYLNGSRIFLSAVPLDNAQVGVAWSTYAAARESLDRLRTFGINFVYTHNYGCQPGSHLGFSEILRAADDLGMLVSFSQPHFGHYTWDAPDAEVSNSYARHAAFYVRAAQNHPSVVMYSMSHNGTGYNEDMEPDAIDGIYDQRSKWSMNNVKKALQAEAIVHRLDRCRIVYHHSSGNLSSMHTSNFYPNFVPIQELSDWFEHWATKGVKPVFLCEYGAPFTWDWAMYRGWYKGKRTFGSATVPWEFCLAEWNAQFFGDAAFRISDREKANLRWEAKRFRAGSLWHRWDYPTDLGSGRFEERHPVLGMYYADNWRAFRTWGLSANSPWEYHLLWLPREGADKSRKDLKVDWDNLQCPGFSPDYIDQRYERMDLAYERSDWVGLAGAQALIRNNGPLLACLAGKPARFTSKDHNFFPGETAEKQIVVINNCRQAVSCDCSWKLDLPQPQSGSQRITLETGQQERAALRMPIPAGTAPGAYRLSMTAKFSTGQTQEDALTLHVLPPRPASPQVPNVALFDPKGSTTELLAALGVACRKVQATSDLAGCDVLIVGKGALSAGSAAPDIGRVRDGLKVLVFEQTPEALEKRLGFRIQEYGLRNVFARVPDHPALRGLQAENLRDWRGEATIVPPRLKCEPSQRYNGAPTITWCGITVTRLWRCGCRRYSPLMEYREGRGMVLFCQMDVTGRTEPDPAAESLARNLVEYVAGWKPAPRREAVYAGDPAGKAHLEAAGLRPVAYDGGELAPEAVLVVGPGGGKALAMHRRDVAAFLKAGGRLLAIGLTQEDAQDALPISLTIRRAEHINGYFEPAGMDSLLAGVGPADVHNRDPRVIPLVTAGARTVADGVLAVAPDTRVVFCQLAPWEFDYRRNFGLKRTFRRTSFLVTRLLANLGVSGGTPLVARFSSAATGGKESRWLQGLYLDTPEEMDDPYRFFRW